VIDQRAWWDAGDSARREDERAGNVAVDAPASELERDLASILDAHFDVDLSALESDRDRELALEAAIHGYVEGRAGGYGQPAWLDAQAT
jgi:hypothetical protein